MSNEKSKTISDAQLTAASKIFSALSEPSRLKLLNLLMGGPKTVSQLVSVSGLQQANVSRHLSLLHQTGLVERSRSGNHVFYRISGSLCAQLCELVCGKLESDAREFAEALSSSPSE